MAVDDIEGTGISSDPWQMTTPPGTSSFEAYRDPDADPPALVVQVGKTQLRYHLSCIEDLHRMLVEHGDWMALGNADEQKPALEGQWRLGVAQQATQSEDRTGSRRVYGAGSGVTYPPVMEAPGLG